MRGNALKKEMLHFGPKATSTDEDVSGATVRTIQKRFKCNIETDTLGRNYKYI